MTHTALSAGEWFLNSGIQEASGGVARYFHTDTGRNAGVSTEITGYAVSMFSWLHNVTGDARFCEAALRSARFLATVAWDESSSTVPFEPGSDRAYFFDLGIIARGLMAAERLHNNGEFEDRLRATTLSMAFDFLGQGGAFHPVLALPEKQPLAYEPRWSRSPGCYQLKAALAWRESSEPESKRLYDLVREFALATHDRFLPGATDPDKIMDRLHAYCYFLEGLLADPDKEALADGIRLVAGYLREIGPAFERSDVCAQLLRVRLCAHHMGLLPLDENAAREEADRASRYRREDGGFWFGSRAGEMLPFANPVSTAFCAQALEMWHTRKPLSLSSLI